MNIKQPPEIISSPFGTIAKECPDKLDDYLEFYSATDHKGRYLHFDDIRHRIPKKLKPNIVWSIIKMARQRQSRAIIKLGEPSTYCMFALTPLAQKAISTTDRNTTKAALEWISSKIGEDAQVNLLLDDLIEDESISSSQLEGAATTTKAAKQMLKQKKEPRKIDEKMIVGNYKMMLFAWENRHQKLSLDLIKELHLIGVEGIDDEKYVPGHFKNNNEVVVEDRDQNVLHVPPDFKNLEKRLKSICKWVNKDHDKIEQKSYIHPLIKAIVLHFSIGYEHPFFDGNGRVARALFYWFMFKKDFATFRYISISHLLKKAPVKYGKSYLHTETDGMDLTYFIEHQCKTVITAIENFAESYRNAAEEADKFNNWLWETGLYNKLTDKQKMVFQVAKNNHINEFTIRNVEHNLGCSYNTAASVLNGLVNLNLFVKSKVGRVWQYKMKSKAIIMDNWKS